MSKSWVQPYESRTFILPAGQEVQWPGMARWVSILSAEVDGIYCEFKPGKSFNELPKGILVPFEEPTECLRFKNPTAASITFKAAKGFLPITDNRLVLLDGTSVVVQFNGTQPVSISMQQIGATLFDVSADTVLVTAIANVNGVNLIDLTLATNSAVSVAGEIALEIGGVALYHVSSDAGGPGIAVMPQPRRIPPGVSVAINKTGSGASRATGSYTVL